MDTKLIIFDFDGTIADTQTAVINITNRLAPEFGFPCLNQEDIDRYRHLKARQIIRQSGVSWWQIPFLMNRVKQELKQQILTIKPIAGIEITLKQLKQENFQLGIITSNSQENATQFLRQQGLLHCFNFVESSFYLFGKDRVIKRLLREKKMSPQAITYVGDETRDIEAARKSGVKVVAVDWGFNAATALANCHPDALISHPSQLVGCFSPQISQC